MSSHIPQPGDRYKFPDTKGIFEITTVHDGYTEVIMINEGNIYQKDDKLYFSIMVLSNHFNSNPFDYLGNFNKMSNFDALYNLLNS